MGEYAVDDEKRVGENKAQEDREQYDDGFLHPAQVEQDERDDEADLGGKLVRLEADRKQREERIDAARDRDRDGEHVVEDERGAGNQARVWTDQAALRRGSRRLPLGRVR